MLYIAPLINPLQKISQSTCKPACQKHRPLFKIPQFCTRAGSDRAGDFDLSSSPVPGSPVHGIKPATSPTAAHFLNYQTQRSSSSTQRLHQSDSDRINRPAHTSQFKYHYTAGTSNTTRIHCAKCHCLLHQASFKMNTLQYSHFSRGFEWNRCI